MNKKARTLGHVQLLRQNPAANYSVKMSYSGQYSVRDFLEAASHQLDNIHNEVYNVAGDNKDDDADVVGVDGGRLRQDEEAGGRAAVEQWQEQVVSVAARGRHGHIEDWILKATHRRRREEEEGYNSDNSVCYSQSFRHDSPCSSDSGCHQVELVFKRRYFRNAPKPYFSDSLRDTLGLAEVTNKEECFKRICKATHFFLAVKMITLGEGPICYDGEAFNRPEWKAANLHRFKRPTQA
ncbi:hypothetical protein J6590_073654 [Homalodisca vitripennis]|nr:hypothetical protein J6590_073654 [Homalodisca vitripennis]